MRLINSTLVLKQAKWATTISKSTCNKGFRPRSLGRARCTSARSVAVGAHFFSSTFRDFVTPTSLVLGLVVATIIWTPVIHAQDEESSEPGSTPEISDIESSQSISQQNLSPEGMETEPMQPSPAEVSSSEWYIGLHGRLNWIPYIFEEIFLEEAPSILGPGLSVVATYRSKENGFSIVFGLGYLSYSTDGPYRAKSDPEEDTEYIESSLGLAYATSSLLWATQFSQMFSLEYGFGLDIGIVTGELRRTEAYPNAAADSGWTPCNGPYDPSEYSAYCAGPSVGVNDEGEHYNVKEDSIVPVMAFPAIPLVALRFSPDPMVAIKAEMAYGIVQFNFGLSLDIAIDGV